MRSTDPERQFGKSNPLSAGHNHDPVEPRSIPLGVCRAALEAFTNGEVERPIGEPTSPICGQI